MNNLREIFKQRKIYIPLRIFDEQDLANAWAVNAIIDNPDLFDNLYETYPLNSIIDFDDYYLYFLSLKLSAMVSIVPQILHDEHKHKVSALATNASEAYNAVSRGDVIKYINNHIVELFNQEDPDIDIQDVTLGFIEKHLSGIKDDTLVFLADNYGYLLIDRFAQFEKIFEKKPLLFEHLFPIGGLSAINPYRVESAFEIWSHLLSKKNSNLRELVSDRIPALYNDIKKMAETATIDDVFQLEGTVRKFHWFLQNTNNPLAYEFEPYAKSINGLLSKRIVEKGQSFQYEIPVNEIIERWKRCTSWEVRLLSITHSIKTIDGRLAFISHLAKEPEIKKSLIDLVSTNIPTDDYYSISHQQELEITAAVGIGTVLGLLRDKETRKDFFSQIVSVINYISEQLQAEGEGLDHDIEMLLASVELFLNNQNAEPRAIHAMCYGASMYICAFSEKIMRLLYMYLMHDRLYVPISKATLGEMLGTEEILKVFGEHHVKGLAFFLLQTPQKHIGLNLRNRLAHWSDISEPQLTLEFTSRLLWIFTDVLNSIFSYFLPVLEEGE